jgi:hypothetical protein
LSVLVSRHLRKLQLTDRDVKSGLKGALSAECEPNGYQAPVLVGGVKFRRVFGGGTASCGITAVLEAYC